MARFFEGLEIVLSGWAGAVRTAEQTKSLRYGSLPPVPLEGGRKITCRGGVVRTASGSTESRYRCRFQSIGYESIVRQIDGADGKKCGFWEATHFRRSGSGQGRLMVVTR